MSGLRDAIAVQGRALAELEQTRQGSSAWSDDQRRSLDRNCLDPLTADGKALLESLRRAAREIADAQRIANGDGG
jgi:hypothetical protein